MPFAYLLVLYISVITNGEHPYNFRKVELEMCFCVPVSGYNNHAALGNCLWCVNVLKINFPLNALT